MTTDMLRVWPEMCVLACVWYRYHIYTHYHHLYVVTLVHVHALEQKLLRVLIAASLSEPHIVVISITFSCTSSLT